MATQQEINDFVEQIMPYFDPTPVEDDSVQQSWPRLDRGLSDVQDMTRFQHLYGIFDRGGRPYWLRGHATDAETNQKNTMFLTVSTTTGTAESTIHGSFHLMKEDIELEFPPVSVPTTQYVVCEYDPIRAADGGDPIVAKVVTSLNYSQGKEYIIHWEVDRRPSQLLSAAPRRTVRPKVTSRIAADTFDAFPDPRTVLWGTVAFAANENAEYRAYGSSEASGGPTQWRPFTSPPWVPSSSSEYASAGGSVASPGYRIVGDKVELRGRIRRTSGSLFYPNNAYNIVPNSPTPTVGTAMNAGSDSSRQPLQCARASGGTIEIYVKNTSPWIDLAGCFYYLR